MKSPETDLPELLNQKKQLAFKILYKEYYRAMVAFGLHYIHRPEVVEDIVQELFTSIWKRDLHFNSLPELKTFLYTSIKNACLNELKREQTRRDYLLSLPAEEPWEEEDDRRWIEEEVYRVLFATVEKLPARCKKIFELHLQGKKNEEIAALMNLSIATVKTQKNRAMNFLREEMGALYLVAILLRIL
ncbi:MAG: RNA polymerase sigma-70 factor [Odoribacteraceae bacterium]|jgi:RNA polymerase sigma-70 factor (ECF subfamily)|nr:RNA polymerase sigma-70 factor [Odoribacteraceae bacterium]